MPLHKRVGPFYNSFLEEFVSLLDVSKIVVFSLFVDEIMIAFSFLFLLMDGLMIELFHLSFCIIELFFYLDVFVSGVIHNDGVPELLLLEIGILDFP